MSKDLDNYLEIVQEEEQLNEFIDPGSIFVGITLMTTALFLRDILIFFLQVSTMKITGKIDEKRSLELRKVLNDGKKWIVRVYPMKEPNAFAVGGKNIFITHGLLKLLNKREIMSIMLHEAYHNKDRHVEKKIAASYPMYWIAVAVFMTSPFHILLSFIIFMLTINTQNILYKRTIGRKHETKSDEYAVQYGYGEDLVSAFNKLIKEIKKLSKNNQCGKLCQVINRINQSIDEHPPLKERIENILKKTKELNNVLITKNKKKIAKFIVGFFKKEK